MFHKSSLFTDIKELHGGRKHINLLAVTNKNGKLSYASWSNPSKLLPSTARIWSPAFTLPSCGKKWHWRVSHVKQRCGLVFVNSRIEMYEFSNAVLQDSQNVFLHYSILKWQKNLFLYIYIIMILKGLFSQKHWEKIKLNSSYLFNIM